MEKIIKDFPKQEREVHLLTVRKRLRGFPASLKEVRKSKRFLEKYALALHNWISEEVKSARSKYRAGSSYEENNTRLNNIYAEEQGILLLLDELNARWKKP